MIPSEEVAMPDLPRTCWSAPSWTP